MSFPNTPYLSTFVGPAENPLSEGGAWTQSVPGRGPLRRDGGGRATDTIHGDANYSHWARDAFQGNSVEVWACLDGGQLGAALETWRVALWVETGGSSKGYVANYGGGIGKSAFLRRYDSGVGVGNFTDIAGTGVDNGYPEKLGLRTIGDDVEVWAQYGGVWGFQCSATDATYRGRFFLGLGIEDPTGGGLSFSCFGGGAPHRTQFFRWTRGWQERGELTT